MRPLKILWLCGVPLEFQQRAMNGQNVGSNATWSWIVGHLPPPPEVELHIACPAKNIKTNIEIQYKDATFHLFPYPRGAAYCFYRSWLPGFKKIYDDIKPAWVHGWGTEAGFSSCALKMSADRCIVGIQGILSDYFPFMQRSLPLQFNLLNERWTLRKASRLLAESQYSQREVGKYTKGSVKIIEHPLRADFLDSSFGARDKMQVVFLGALNDGKGIKDAIVSFSEYAPAGWHMVCIGSGTPDYEIELNRLIQKLKMVNRIKIRRALSADEITDIYRESPVFFLPTYMDTGPTALKEALAMGLWPVCYDNSGPRELINRYGYGSLVETGDVKQLGATLRQVLDQKPWENKDAVEACVQRIRQDLSPNKVWEKLLTCYMDDCWV